jgi:thymidylate synthase (FAD)
VLFRSGVTFSKDEFAELKRRLEGGGASGGLGDKALERFEEKLKTGKQL